ncbi:MAG: T9SS type A sorting domain-containing protein [Ignavibacterium sp.]|nr:T9SS type A sorting domain-containing protein [Ignavibacterium sp.]
MKINFVIGHGTSTELQNYSYTDDNLPAGKYQYRLKQIDMDGTFNYSNTVEIEILAPNEFVLEQNFPNPFNPNTKISWQSPVGGHHTLIVYDVIGNEVATLVNEYKPAGAYEVIFDPSSLSSGVYFYKLVVDKFSSVKKMILMR